MGISLSGVTQSSTGNLTISAGSGNDVLIGNGSTQLFIDGGSDTLGIGAAASTVHYLNIYPTYTAAAGNASIVTIGGTLTPSSADNLSGLLINPTLVEHSSGTHTRMVSLDVRGPTVTNAGGATADTAAIYIHSIATGATPTGTAYALWVNDGAVRFDDRTFTIGGIAYEFPANNGDGNQVLTTDGSGNLSWAAPIGVSTGSGTSGKIPKWTSSSAQGDSVMVEASSNIGIGVTPFGSWNTSQSVLNLFSQRVAFHGESGHALMLSQNAYVDSGNGWKYVATAGATNYYAHAGSHYFRTAASGSAGAAITWTSAMTILADGKVGIGTAAPDNLLHITDASAGSVVGHADALLVIESDASTYINLLGADNGAIGIMAGSATGGNNDGQLFYEPNANRWSFGSATNNYFMRMDSSNVVFNSAETISTTAGNLTLSAATGADVIIGDNANILYVDGGTDSVFIGVASAGVAAKLLIESSGTGFQSQISFTNPQAHAAGVGHAINFYGGSGDQNMAAIQAAWVGSSASNGAYMQFATRQVSDGALVARMRIDTSGNVLINTEKLISVGGLDVVGGASVGSTNLQIAKNSSNANMLLSTHHTTDAYASVFMFLKSGYTTINPSRPNGAVADDEFLGAIGWAADDGYTYASQAARITVEVDGAVAQTKVPGRMKFWTTPVGVVNPLPRMTITNDGNVGIGVTPTTQEKFIVNTTNSGADARRMFRVLGTVNVVAGSNGQIATIGGTLVEAGSGTHDVMSGLALAAPAITNAGGATADASTLWILGAPTGATPTGGNYALWVDSGTSRFDGEIIISDIASPPTVANSGFWLNNNNSSRGLYLNDSSEGSGDKLWSIRNSVEKLQFKTHADNSVSTTLNVMTLLRTGTVGIGTTAPLTYLDIARGSGAASQIISTYSATVGHNSNLSFYKSANNTVGNLTATGNTHRLGGLSWVSVSSSSAWVNSASISAVVTAAASARPAAKLEFQTSDGTNIAPRMIINSDGTTRFDGRVGIGNDASSTYQLFAYDTGARYATLAGSNGIIGSFYRNVSGDAQPVVDIQQDHASNAYPALKITQDGTGWALDVQGPTVSGYSAFARFNNASYANGRVEIGQLSGEGELNVYSSGNVNAVKLAAYSSTSIATVDIIGGNDSTNLAFRVKNASGATKFSLNNYGAGGSDNYLTWGGAGVTVTTNAAKLTVAGNLIVYTGSAPGQIWQATATPSLADRFNWFVSTYTGAAGTNIRGNSWSHNLTQANSHGGGAIIGHDMSFAFTASASGTGGGAGWAGVNLGAPTITANGETITSPATLKIAGPPSAGTSPYSLWVAAGNSRFDGNVAIIGDESGTNTLAGGGTASILIRNADDTDNTHASLDFYNYAGYLTAKFGAQFTDTSDRDTDLYFATRADGGNLTEHMRIASTGRVGIGSGASSIYKLHIHHGNDAYVQLGSSTSNIINAYRNLSSGSTSAPVVAITQDHSGDDQDALRVTQDGSGYAIKAKGYIRVDEGGSNYIRLNHNQVSGEGTILYLQYTSAYDISMFGSGGSSRALNLTSADLQNVGTTGSGWTPGNITIRNTANYSGASHQAFTTTPTETAYLDLERSNHATLGNYTVVTQGDVIGQVSFRGSTGSGFSNGARIMATADETWSGSAHGAKLEFKTADNASTTLDTRMIITHDGSVGIGVSEVGIDPVQLHLDSSDDRFLEIRADGINDAGIFIGCSTHTHPSGETNLLRSGGWIWSNASNGDFLIDHADERTGASPMSGIKFRTRMGGSSKQYPLMIQGIGSILFNQGDAPSPFSGQSPVFEFYRSGGAAVFVKRGGSRGDLIGFHNDSNNFCGAIQSGSGDTTVYATSSDYRLKENITRITSGSIARLKLLQPSNFNFITAPDVAMEGFIAHEAQAVVPLAVTGVKDGMETVENSLGEEVTVPLIQGMDNAKLVPLLVGALQEAVAKIEALEAKVTVLEG